MVEILGFHRILQQEPILRGQQGGSGKEYYKYLPGN
jgi:hypothetical protein